MHALQIDLLGSLQVLFHGQAAPHFATVKAQALLAYLAVEAESAHTRDALIGLFWPDYPQTSARLNLRQTLFHLRQVIPSAYLLTTRQTIQFDPHSDYSLDVTTFDGLLTTCRQHAHASLTTCPTCIGRLTQAAALYRGDLLTGFFVEDSPLFEEWLLLKREWLRRAALQALQQLASFYEQQGEYNYAYQYAWRQVELDPVREEAYQQLMRALALSGRRSEALAQYETCRRKLAAEFGLEPNASTVALYEQIRHNQVGKMRGWQDNRLNHPVTVSPPYPVTPLPLTLAPSRQAHEPTPFVARARELAWLQTHLHQAGAGQGHIVFVQGEAGSGKSALLREFAERAQAANSALLVAGSQCQAQGGVGDPYLPFRHLMRLLTGEVDLPGAQASLSQAHFGRLAAQAPVVSQSLLEHGPDLINSFVPGPALLRRMKAQTDPAVVWLHRLEQIVYTSGSAQADAGQSDLFDQYSQVLLNLARHQPLLLFIDDLHWVDTASLNLLFHLGRQLANRSILLIGAYRSEDVALGRRTGDQWARHPLEPLLNEFKRQEGEIILDLDQAPGRTFIDAWLDTQPNCLGSVFRMALYRRTRGKPLYTLELLRMMRERGDLVLDASGQWVESSDLNWRRLPARVEAIVAERIARLPEELRQLLAVACVEGETFTLQVVAKVQGIPERILLQQMTRELEKRHRLVGAQIEATVGQRFITRCQFTHALFQEYLYHQLSAGERRLLHGEVAAALVELYQGRTDEITAPLAYHYAQAGVTTQAAHYLLQVGDRARTLFAHQEAIAAYQQALGLLTAEHDYERAARTLMKMGLTYHLAFDFRQAQQAYDEGFLLWRQGGEQQAVLIHGKENEGQTLRLVWDEPPTLDPARVVDMLEIVVIDQLFSGLVEWSAELDIVPAVAHTWEVLDGGCKYIFHLRPDARWSDGAPVTAEDFVYAWRRALNPATGSLYGSLLLNIKGARELQCGLVNDPERLGVYALNAQTLMVELEEPTGYFLHLLAQSPSYPVPRHLVETHGARWTDPGRMVSNGPFQLETWQPSHSMTLTRNPAYTGRFTGNIEKINLSLTPHTAWATRLAAYTTGASDFLDLWGFPPLEAERTRQRFAGDYVSTPWLFTGYLGFDLSRPPFADERVRRAFALATDREMVANIAMQGYVAAATGGSIPAGLAGHTPGLGLAYDPAVAGQLLAAAGYPSGRGFPLLEAVRPPNPADVILSEALQAQWREVLGIEVRWQSMNWEQFANQLHRRELQLFYGIFLNNYPDPNNCLGWYNHVTGAQLREFSRYFEQARYASAQQERLQLYTQADRVLVEQAGIVPLYYGRLHLLMKPWVKKYATSLIKAWFWKDLLIEPHG